VGISRPTRPLVRGLSSAHHQQTYGRPLGENVGAPTFGTACERVSPLGENMTNDTGTEPLTVELERSRVEMTALTDSVARLRHVMEASTAETKMLTDILTAATRRRGF